MKVLVLSTKLPYPAKDGGAIATLNLACGLADTGIELSLLSFNTKKHYFPPENIPAEIQKAIRIHTVDTDTSVSILKAFSNLIFSSQPYVAERFAHSYFTDKLIKLLSENDFQIVQLEGPYFASYLPTIRKYSSAIVALRAHNIEHEIWEQRWKNEKRPLQKLYLKNLSKRIRRLEENLFKKIDLLIPISQRDGDLIKKINPTLEQCVIPSGINISEYTPAQTNVKRDIFFIGALDWAPNIEGLRWFMKEVIPHLTAKESVNIHIAGRNAAKNFETLISHPSVSYHGEIEDAQLFMKEHGVMAVPLLSGSGIRIKILEGMALGKCIVSTAIGVEGIPAIDGKHLLVGNDAKSFANHLLNILNNKVLSDSLSTEARNLIQEKFDTFAIASKLGNHYKKLL